MKKELANNFRRTPKFQTKWKRKAKFALARVDIACRRGPTRPNKQPSRHGISHTNNLSFFRIVPNSKEIHLTMHFQVDPFWRGPAAVAACAPPHELRSPLPQDCVHPEPHAPLPAMAARPRARWSPHRWPRATCSPGLAGPQPGHRRYLPSLRFAGGRLKKASI